MTEEQKQQVAVFRFGIIHDFVGATRLDHGERERLLREKCARKWEIPCSNQTRLSRSTILRWVGLYLQEGRKLEALYPQERNDKGRSRVLDQETGAALAQLRRQLPDLTVVDLVKQMHQRSLVTDGIALSLSTAYRFLHRHDLMAKQPVAVDRRKFEAELPNDLWQSDVMHGPTLLAGDKRRKTYLIAFIDDHSRLITHARFYLSEGVACFMTAFANAVLRRGLPRKLYVDNGSAFRSRQLEYTTAALGIALVHARPYQPQGKGKIERFFKNVRTRFLPSFRGDTLEEINEAMEHWLDEEYHRKIHSSTGETPFKRFTSRLECLRAAPDNLKDFFRKTVRRRVNKDRSVVVDRRLFEAPVELIGKRVELLYCEESLELVEIRYAEKSYGLLRQVDLHVNSRVKRDKNGEIELSGDGACKSGRLWEG